MLSPTCSAEVRWHRDLGVLSISIAMRDRPPHAFVVPSASASAESAAARAAPNSSAAPSTSNSAGAPAAPAGLGRALRVSGAGWELLAPIILANDGLEPKLGSDVGKTGILVSVTVARDLDAIESALARGGADEAGADVAVVPLAALIGSYQKLGALRPVVILVSAWSRGRELLRGKQPLEKLPQTGEIVLALESDPASTYFALFALELSGVAPARIRPAERGDAKVQVTALTRGEIKATEQKDVLLSTAEATRFAPYVLVCPSALVEKHPEALNKLIKGWLSGAKRLASDPTASARSISALEDAPEPIALLSRLGEISQVGLGENAELLGLSGRGAVTVEALLARMWRLGRESRTVTIPAPERAPVAPEPVAQLIRADPSQARPDASTPLGKIKPGARPLLVARTATPFNAYAAQSEIGFVTGVFQRSPIRVSASDRKLAETLIRQSADRFAIAEGRLSVGTAASRAAEAVVEVLPIP